MIVISGQVVQKHDFYTEHGFYRPVSMRCTANLQLHRTWLLLEGESNHFIQHLHPTLFTTTSSQPINQLPFYVLPLWNDKYQIDEAVLADKKKKHARLRRFRFILNYISVFPFFGVYLIKKHLSQQLHLVCIISMIVCCHQTSIIDIYMYGIV